MKDKIIYEKLNEDDILEIVSEYLQEKHNKAFAKIVSLGESGKDLRCVCAISDTIPETDLDLADVDKTMDFTGDHSFLEKYPDFLF